MRLPPAAVTARRQHCRFGITDDLLAFRIEVKRVASAPGDVAEVTEQGGLLAFLDFGSQGLALPNPVNEVGKVQDIVRCPFDFTNELLV